MRWLNVPLVAALASGSIGCAEQVHLVDRGATAAAPPMVFWPPPDATAVWAAGLTNDLALGQAAQRVASALSNAGYSNVRWYPIGANYLHGFAATTRLERITRDATLDASRERWTALLPEAADLLWLENDRQPRLPASGRYRIFLIAFTDLPVAREAHRAPRRSEENVMEAPGMRSMDFPAARPSPGYQIVVYVYEYESDAGGDGSFVSNDPQVSAGGHVRASGLSALGWASSTQSW